MLDFVGALLGIVVFGYLLGYFLYRIERRNHRIGVELASALGVLLREQLPELGIRVSTSEPRLWVVARTAPGVDTEVEIVVRQRTVEIRHEGNSATIPVNRTELNGAPRTTDAGAIDLKPLVEYFERKIALRSLTEILRLDEPSHWETLEVLEGDHSRLREYIEFFENYSPVNDLEKELLGELVIFSLDFQIYLGEDTPEEKQLVSQFLRSHGALIPKTVDSWLGRKEDEHPAVVVVREAMSGSGNPPI